MEARVRLVEGPIVALKAFFAAALAAAIVVGLCLPLLLSRAEPRSQIDQLDVARR